MTREKKQKIHRKEWHKIKEHVKKDATAKNGTDIWDTGKKKITGKITNKLHGKKCLPKICHYQK